MRCVVLLCAAAALLLLSSPLVTARHHMVKSIEQVKAVAGGVPWVLLVSTVTADEYGAPQTEAGVCLQYHQLLSRGIPADHIVTMSLNVGPTSEDNPWNGHLYAEPHGKDVLPGCVLDYDKEKLVTVANFENVVLGNAAAMKGIGTGRVLAAGADDSVFIFYQDHGDVGLIVFPEKDYTTKQLQTLLTKRAATVKAVAMNIMACFSGSMFSWLKPASTAPIFGLVSSNASTESSSSYCGSYTFDNITSHDTCLLPAMTAAHASVIESKPAPTFTLEDSFQGVKNWMALDHEEPEGYKTIPQEFGSDAIKKTLLSQIAGSSPAERSSQQMPKFGSSVQASALECALRSYLRHVSPQSPRETSEATADAEALDAALTAALSSKQQRSSHYNAASCAVDISAPVQSVSRPQFAIFFDGRRVQRALERGDMQTAKQFAGKLRARLAQRAKAAEFIGAVADELLTEENMADDVEITESMVACRSSIMAIYRDVCAAPFDAFSRSQARATLSALCDSRTMSATKVIATAARVASKQC